MSARVIAFVLWAAVAACLTYWALRIGTTAPPLPASVQPVSTAMVLHGDVQRLFASAKPVEIAAAPTAPALASRFKLIGVMAPRAGQGDAAQGLALIAVDGKPPRPFRVGAPLDAGLVLQSVATRAATLGPAQGAAAVKLELPPLATPATGSLPPPPSFSPSYVPPQVAPAIAPTLQPDQAPPLPDTGDDEPVPRTGATLDPNNRR